MKVMMQAYPTLKTIYSVFKTYYGKITDYIAGNIIFHWNRIHSQGSFFPSFYFYNVLHRNDFSPA